MQLTCASKSICLAHIFLSPCLTTNAGSKIQKGKESNTQLTTLQLINRDKLDKTKTGKHKTNTINLLITFLSTNVNILFAIFGIFSSLNPDLLTFPTLLTLSSIGLATQPPMTEDITKIDATTTTKTYPTKWGWLHGSNEAILFYHIP
jgi:hypothetical protein